MSSSDEDAVFGHARAVAADHAADLEHEAAVQQEETDGARVFLSAVLGEEAAEQALPRREPNPYVGEFDGARPQSEELRDRVRLAMEKAMRLEEEGTARFAFVVPGPESLYSLSMACHAAAFFPEFRKDPRALELVVKLGRDMGTALAEFPGHSASLRPLGQMLQAMWEAYGRLGPEALLSRYSEQGHAQAPVRGGHDHEGPMPGVGFEGLACALSAAAEAAAALAGYGWHEHDAPSVTEMAPPASTQSDAARCGGCGALATVRTDVEFFCTGCAPVRPDWEEAIRRAAFPADTESVTFQQGAAPDSRWFGEPTPVADSVVFELSDTQVIPPPVVALALAGDEVTEVAPPAEGYLLSEFAGHESWRCARCASILNGIPKGQGTAKLIEHQADPALCTV